MKREALYLTAGVTHKDTEFIEAAAIQLATTGTGNPRECWRRAVELWRVEDEMLKELGILREATTAELAQKSKTEALKESVINLLATSGGPLATGKEDTLTEDHTRG